jgi:hypothetical protein
MHDVHLPSPWEVVRGRCVDGQEGGTCYLCFLSAASGVCGSSDTRDPVSGWRLLLLHKPRLQLHTWLIALRGEGHRAAGAMWVLAPP